MRCQREAAPVTDVVTGGLSASGDQSTRPFPELTAATASLLGHRVSQRQSGPRLGLRPQTEPRPWHPCQMWVVTFCNSEFLQPRPLFLMGVGRVSWPERSLIYSVRVSWAPPKCQCRELGTW